MEDRRFFTEHAEGHGGSRRKNRRGAHAEDAENHGGQGGKSKWFGFRRGIPLNNLYSEILMRKSDCAI